MPDVTTLYKLQTGLRRYPRVQRPLKKIYDFFRCTIPKTIVELVRIFAPTRSFRFGPPKGSFSIYESLLMENRRPGTVVLADQRFCLREPPRWMGGRHLHRESVGFLLEDLPGGSCGKHYCRSGRGKKNSGEGGLGDDKLNRHFSPSKSQKRRFN